jgi:hypothetical protein
MLPNVSINLTSTVSPKTGNRNSSHFWVGFHKLPSFWVSPFIHVHLPSLDHHYTILYHHYCYTIVLPWLSHHFLIIFSSTSHRSIFLFQLANSCCWGKFALETGSASEQPLLADTVCKAERVIGSHWGGYGRLGLLMGKTMVILSPV